MKGIGKLLFGLLLGICISVLVSYYNKTLNISDLNFSMGLIAGAAFMSFVFVLFSFRTSKNTNSKTEASKLRMNGIVICFIIMTIGLLGSHLLSNSDEKTKNSILTEENKTKLQVAALAIEKNKAQGFWMNNMVDQMEKELSNTPERTLSEETIFKLKDLSKSLQPYYNIQSDTISDDKFSPEKGNLLLTLKTMKMDSVSFKKVLKEISFSQIELLDVDLSDTNLAHTDFSNSNMPKTKLVGSNLSNSKLEKTNFTNANLSQSNLNGANFLNAKMNWANLKEVKANAGIFDGAKLSNANFYRADLKDATLKWCKATNTSFKEAILQGANLSTSDLSKGTLNNANLTNCNLSFTKLIEANIIEVDASNANFSHANLENADLRNAHLVKAIFKKANLKGVKLLGAKVDKIDWFKQLADWEVEGLIELKEKYNIVPINQDSIYQLIKIKK